MVLIGTLRSRYLVLHNRSLLLLVCLFSLGASSLLWSRSTNAITTPQRLKDQGGKLFAKGNTVQASHCFRAVMQLTEGLGGDTAGVLRLNSCLILAECLYRDYQYDSAIAKCTDIVNEVVIPKQPSPKASTSTAATLHHHLKSAYLLVAALYCRAKCWRKLQYDNLALTDALRAKQIAATLPRLQASMRTTAAEKWEGVPARKEIEEKISKTSKLLESLRGKAKSVPILSKSVRRKNERLLYDLTEEFCAAEDEKYRYNSNNDSDDSASSPQYYSDADIKALLRGKKIVKQSLDDVSDQHASDSNSNNNSSSNTNDNQFSHMMSLAGPMLGISSGTISTMQRLLNAWSTVRKIIKGTKSIAVLFLFSYWSYSGLQTLWDVYCGHNSR